VSIIYPLAYPAYTRLTNFSLRERTVGGMTVAPFSRAQQVQEFPGAGWEAEISFPPLTDTQYRQWGAFFSSLHGQSGYFIMGHPLLTRTAGIASTVGGLPQIDGNGQNGSLLNIKTGLGNLPNYLKAGDMFSIGLGDGRRMHKVLTDVTLVLGKATLDIWPRLRYPPPDNDLIYFNDPSTQWRMTNNTFEQNASGSDAGLWRVPSVSLVEKIP
jgi:hypothetical protein